MRRLVAFLLPLAFALAGCGGDDESSRVKIAVDPSAAGDPALVKGPSGDRQQQRVPITPGGVPTAIYAVRLADLESGDSLRALSAVTVTKCQKTDYEPTQRQFTGCEFTKRYSYNPVAVETRFRALPSDGDKPDLSADGTDVGPTNKVSCTNLKHHCTILNIGEAEAGGSDLEWVVLEMTARSPKASSCEPRRAGNCEVLAVEVQKGTVMYVVDQQGDVPDVQHLPRDPKQDRQTLRVVDDETQGASRQAGRQVVYSIPLAAKGKVKELRGDQFEVGALLRVSSETRRYAPLITTYFVLSSSRDGVTGRYLESDSYSSARTGNSGENCSGSCTFLRGSAATPILPCDVRAGRRFVNLVAGAARDVAPPGSQVKVDSGGGMRIVRYFENDISANAKGSC